MLTAKSAKSDLFSVDIIKLPRYFAFAVESISSLTNSSLILFISLSVSTTALSVTAFLTDVVALKVALVHLFLAIELLAPYVQPFSSLKFMFK